MYSNNQRKLILQLNKKKFRLANKLFVVEGKKVVNELINAGWVFKMLFSTEDNFHKKADIIKDEEMKKITHFNSPSPVLGVFELPDQKKILAESTTIAVDGISNPKNFVVPCSGNYHYRTIKAGDTYIPEISCASIIAKVLRDKEMTELHEQFPVYDFIRNKGYGTQKHVLALKENGASEVHRLSFKPIRKD